MKRSLRNAVMAGDFVAVEGLLHRINMQPGDKTSWYIAMQPELLRRAAFSCAGAASTENAAAILYRMIEEVKRNHNGKAAAIFDGITDIVDAALARTSLPEARAGFEQVKDILVSRRPGISTLSLSGSASLSGNVSAPGTGVQHLRA